MHDKNFLKELSLTSHSMVVFDRAYNYYHQFSLWTEQKIFFVTRQKSNAVYRVTETKREHNKVKDRAMVLREEIIDLEYIPEDAHGKRQNGKRKHQTLCRICYQDEQNSQYVFLTNAMEISNRK